MGRPIARPPAQAVVAVATILVLCAGRAGHGRQEVGGVKTPKGLASLRALEDRLRGEIDVRQAAGGDRVTGPDPYLIRPLPDGAGAGLVGLLRGSAEIVLLDRDVRIIDRAPAPRAPTGMAVAANGEVFVCGELAPQIVRYQVTARSIRRTGAIALAPGHGARDVAVGPEGLLYAVDQRAGRLLTIEVGVAATAGAHQAIGGARTDMPIGHGPIRVARVGPWLIVDLLLDHELVVFRTDGQGRPTGAPARVQHDGPIWSFDAVLVPDSATPAAAEARDPSAREDLIVVAGGVEDHPLDRTIGSFGYIDSFLTVYRISVVRGAPRATRLGAVNLSAIGLVTPKVIDLESPSLSSSAGGGRALVTGYGSSLMAIVDWPRFDLEPTVVTRPLAPGTTSVVRRDDGALVFADPLLDAWLVATPAGVVTTVSIEPVATLTAGAVAGAPTRSSASRLGEALFFTILMAPFNRADGPASRFTCETCHFEGGVDGRTHHTGRGEVRATTKPLRGLLNNRPYFSRALDPDLATMVNNEFRVAGANSGHDPWFDLRVEDFPWLRTMGVTDADLPALSLRRALISFLAGLSHWPNPVALAATGYSAQQSVGAAVFRDRCEGCHQARLSSDDPASRVPFKDWERSIFSEPNPLVWGSSDYQQTGIVPYVHERGARVPSLRRVSAKFPYFTNGSSQALDQVIARARFDGGAFSHNGGHDGGPAGEAGLDGISAAALAAFLELL